VPPIDDDRVKRSHRKTIVQDAADRFSVTVMRDVVNRGTGAPLRARGFKFNVGGKTGTSRDGWFAGFTPNLVCVVWVGFDEGLSWD